jgi:hypothetical protein
VVVRTPSVATRLVASAVLGLTGIAGVAFGLAATTTASASNTTAGHHPSHPSQKAHTAALVMDGQKVTTLTLEGAKPYQPVAAPHTWDDYHCTLLNPHITENSYIVASNFIPTSVEVHHAILFLVPPNMVAAAEAADRNGKGWSCFGEAPIPGSSGFQFANTPWLAAWGPGAPENIEPIGTGVPIAAGSLVIMQIHYTLLRGDKPVQSRMQLMTIPQSKVNLKPLSLGLYVAPPDIPCPAGIHGPLCNRAASLAFTGKQFGASEIKFINTIEWICGRNPSNPPAGDTTTCTWPIQGSGNIVRIAPHMHLLGVRMKVTLNPGTPNAKVLVNEPYNFDYQHAWSMPKPVPVTPADKLQVTCTYNPKLRQEIPFTRNLPPQFITWGDGSADEMCLAIVLMTPPS